MDFQMKASDKKMDEYISFEQNKWSFCSLQF